MGTLQVNTKASLRPPRIVVHAKGGVGKTTFGASVPGCVFIPLEEGLGTIEVPHFNAPESYVAVMNNLRSLLVEEHDYKAVVIDTVDKLERLVWDHTCATNSTPKKTLVNIEDFGYGKGYTYADVHWVEFFKRLDMLRAKGMTIVVLSHNEVKSIADPTGPYDSFSPKLHKRANALLFEWADIVGYLDVEKAPIEVEGARKKEFETTQLLSTRYLHLEQAGFEAKNRYKLPKRILIPEKNGYAPVRAEILKSFGLDPKGKPLAAAKKSKKKAAKKKTAAEELLQDADGGKSNLEGARD